MRSVKERANAKINLYLDILNKRDDGFHDIKTIMHSVTFGDDIVVTASPADESSVSLLLLGNRFLPTDNRNLAVKAAYAFLRRAKIAAQVNIKMTKRIPVSAGLAGGSSDAAAVLRALNKLYGKFFSISALMDIAAELGSDVAYCLYGKCALCEGRGEIITRIKTRLGYSVVLAIGNEHVSTPVAYKTLDAAFSDFDGSVKRGGEEHFTKLVASLKNDRISADGVFNIFERAILPECPDSAKIKQMLLNMGAFAAAMSGSGPSVFGIFDSYRRAKEVAQHLRGMGYKAFYANFV